MRIAAVHNLPPGGAHRRLANQLRYLRGDVVEVCLGTAAPITPDPIVVPFAPTAPAAPRPLRPPLRYVDLALLERAWRRATQHIRSARVDVMYLNPCCFLQAPPVLFRDAPPAVYFCDEVRRVDSEKGAGESRNPATKPIYSRLYARERRLDRLTASRAARLVTNSRYTASEIARVYGRRAEVVTMGVAEAMLAPRAPVGRQGFLLSVGSLRSGKGHELVLQTAARAAKRPAMIIAAPRPAHKEQAQLEALAMNLGVRLEVRVAIPDAELAVLYASAYATLYLARLEPLGLVSLEAQACGCPVIVADEGGLPETIIDGVTGWKVPRDPAVAAKLVDRLADKGLYDSMAAAASKHAREWQWATSAAQLETLFAAVQSGTGELQNEPSFS